MNTFKVLKIKEGIFDQNKREADELRDNLKEEGVFLIN